MRPMLQSEMILRKQVWIPQLMKRMQPILPQIKTIEAYGTAASEGVDEHNLYEYVKQVSGHNFDRVLALKFALYYTLGG